MSHTADKPQAPGQGCGPATSRHPDVLGGRRVVAGTRVPVEVIFENLADGLTVDDIVKSYPAVSKAALLAVLAEARERMTDA